MRAPLLSKDHRRRLALPSAYRNTILSTAPNNLIQYLPYWEPVGATAMPDQSLEANDAVADTVVFGSPGIGDGHKAGAFDGANSFVNAYSAGFNADFDGQELTVFGWSIVNAVGDWANGNFQGLFRFLVDANNFIDFRKTSNTNQVQLRYTAGSTAKAIVDTTLAATVDYFSWAITASLSADALILYLNGVQVGSTQTSLGTWTGNLLSTETVFGATTTVPGIPWLGSSAHNAVWNTPLDANAIKRLSIIN